MSSSADGEEGHERHDVFRSSAQEGEEREEGEGGGRRRWYVNYYLTGNPRFIVHSSILADLRGGWNMLVICLFTRKKTEVVVVDGVLLIIE